MIRIKKIFLALSGLLLLGMIVMIILGWFEKVDDFRILIVSDKGIVLRSISWQRRMVNELVVEGQVRVWVPKGMSWYRSDKIKKLLETKNKQNLASDMAFYNFGFIPDVVIFNNNENWLYNPKIVNKWGVINYLKFITSGSGLMIKSEVVDKNLVDSIDKLDEIVQRDFSDSRLLSEDIRLAIYNLGQSNGMAGFVSRILEWSGFTVVGVENLSDNVGLCRINYGDKVEGSYTLAVIKKMFGECKLSKDNEIGETEMELYFGDKFSQMLNYQGYSN